MTTAIRIAIGAIAAGSAALAAHRARSLTGNGGLAATIIGTAAVAAGWDWGALLIAYFVVTAFLSRLGATRKRGRLDGLVGKTGARDAMQVTANGLPFFVCALMWTASPYDHLLIWQTCGAASLAASAADTWATEMGTLVAHPPRSVLTGRRMVVGQSGGVSVPGWLGAIAGALFVGAIAAVVMPSEGLTGFGMIVIGGIAGTTVDSVVGASLQRRSWCDVCDRPTEMRIHNCGAATRHTGGFAWLENDGVNLIATITGAVVPAMVIVAVVHSLGRFL